MANTMPSPKYWVEARTAIKTKKVMEYGVWHINSAGARECVQTYSAHCKGGWEMALYLAEMLRDDLNDAMVAAE